MKGPCNSVAHCAVVCLFSILINCASAQTSAENSIAVSITVTGIKLASGSVFIAAYDQESRFLSDNGYHTRQIVPVQSVGMLVATMYLPAGEYAFSLFHDENNNGILDKSVFHMPKEPYAFSGNPVFRFGPPKFKDVKIVVNADNTHLEFSF